MSNDIKVGLTITADASSAKPVIKDLAAEEQKIAQNAQAAAAQLANQNKQLQNTTLTAGQMTQALRQVPLQFTDIVTSLGSGQKPLQVLLQQGGQLKDSFGGVGAAVQGLAGYIKSLITPMSAAVAVATAFGAALYSGARDAEILKNALVLSGGASGKTYSDLENLASSVGRLTGKYSEARDITVQLAQSGKFAGEQLDIALRGVLATSQSTGKGVGDVADLFLSLATNPTQAIYKLNESYNFLSAATFKQIKLLQEQGDKQGAVTLALKAFSDEMQSRQGKIVENTGLIERAWIAVKSAIDGAKNSLLYLGREDSIDQKIADIENKLAARVGRSGQFAVPRVSGETKSGRGGTYYEPSEYERLQNELVKLKTQKVLDDARAKAEAKDRARENSQIDKIANEKSPKASTSKSVDQDAEAAKRFVEQLTKQADTLGLTKTQLIAYEASHLKLTEAQRDSVRAAIDSIKTNDEKIANEKLAKEMVEASAKAEADRAEALRKLDQENAAKEQRSIDAMNAKAEAIREVLDPTIKLKQEQSELNDLVAKGVITQKAMDDYLKKTADSTSRTKDTTRQLGLTFTSAFEDAVISGKKLSDVLGGLAQDIERILLRKLITEPLAEAIGNFDFGSIFGSSGIFGGGGDGMIFNAKGGIYPAGDISQYSNSIVNKPTFFTGSPRAFAKGGNVMGEAGTEGIFPLKRMSSGNLGVEATSAGSNVVVNLYEAPGTKATVQQQQGADGQMNLSVVVEQLYGMMSRDISRGGGLAPTLERRYGLNRTAGGM